LVLLGHYHKYQKFEKNIYYSGSIYKYSASEYNNKKGVLIHDLKEETHQFIELSPKKNLHYIVGTFQEIITKIHKQFNKHQTENDYFYIELDEKNLISYVKDELSRYYKNIVNISYKNEDIFSNTSKININHKEINQLNEIELFKKFLEYLYLEEEDQNLDDVLYEQTGFKKQELLDTYQELWEEFRKHQS
jgi:exonuclease SbcD